MDTRTVSVKAMVRGRPDCWVCPSPPQSPLIKPSASLPEPVPGPEPFRKKDVVEILSHKKAYNTCEGLGRPRG